MSNKREIILHDEICNVRSKCQFERINTANKIKYLGIEMSSNMKWKEHIFPVSNKIRKMIYTVKELRDLLKEKYLKLIYLTLTEPIMSYEIKG